MEAADLIRGLRALAAERGADRPHRDDQRSGPPDALTATSLPFCSVYIVVPLTAGAVSDANEPVTWLEDFDRISGESYRNHRRRQA
jgi:hypothetical protein